MQIISALFLILSIFQIDEPSILDYVLKNQLKIDDSCVESPCLFGESLKGMTVLDVENLLEGSPISDVITEITSENWILGWLWTDEFTSQLNIDYSQIRDSSVSFYNGEAHWVWISFNIELQELIQIYGEPTRAVPHTYRRNGDMDFLVFFEDVEGYFTARTRCEEPELVFDTRIVGYRSSVKPPYIDNIIEWHGYTDDLPTCIIFQP